jgi:His-Xaa-Ser system protein HxsD
MSPQPVVFDLGAQSLDAVQRAAYRLSDRASFEITVGEGSAEVLLTPTEGGDRARLEAELRNEVLDQVLRERIREETADVRNLILALAFSRTGLTEADE